MTTIHVSAGGRRFEYLRRSIYKLIVKVLVSNCLFFWKRQCKLCLKKLPWKRCWKRQCKRCLKTLLKTLPENAADNAAWKRHRFNFGFEGWLPEWFSLVTFVWRYRSKNLHFWCHSIRKGLFPDWSRRRRHLRLNQHLRQNWRFTSNRWRKICVTNWEEIVTIISANF